MYSVGDFTVFTKESRKPYLEIGDEGLSLFHKSVDQKEARKASGFSRGIEPIGGFMLPLSNSEFIYAEINRGDTYNGKK